jgi:hypothetical protein
MPVICRFFGIIIFMNWDDHSPPHFHAKYQDHEVLIEIQSGNVNGNMPGRALEMLQEWRRDNFSQLMENWDLAADHKPLKKLPVLE